jgi:hypothetical protein
MGLLYCYTVQVFQNIMTDESEHVKTVNACQLNDETLMSPNTAAANAGTFSWGHKFEN